MQPKKSRALVYIGSSLALIIVAIVFSSFLNQREPAETPSSDIRARANAPGLVKVTGLVNEVNEGEGTIVVENLAFEDSTKSLGTWTVTAPISFSLSTAFPGAKLIITVDPPTMMAQSRTLTATEIIIQK
jgi:hypothetical protein